MISRVTWFALWFLVVLHSVQLPQAHGRIVVGVSTVNVAFLPIYLTQDRGFFKDEGLEVLVVMFNAGATNLQAVIGGDVQIMAGGVPETVLARASGLDIKNFWAISNVMPFQIYGSPKMKSLKDSKGKKFAISRFGSEISGLALPIVAIVVLDVSAFKVALLGTIEFLPFILLALPAAWAASWGFMLPSGTGPNAIAWATGHIALPRMLKAGLLIDLAGVPLMVGIVWLIAAVMG